MKNLILFELAKLKKQKSLYICVAIMLAVIVLSVFTVSIAADIMTEMIEEEGLPAEEFVVEYDPITSMLQAASTGEFALLIGIVIVLFVTSDFKQGTIKVVIARGYSRTKIYYAKLVSAIIMSVGAYLACLITGLISGFIFFDFVKPESARWLGVLAVQMVAAVAVAVFCYVVAVTFRKTSSAILFILFAPIGLELVLGIVDLLADTNLADYWITTVFQNLSVTSVGSSRIVGSLIASVAYLAAFFGLGYINTQKYDF